MNYLKQLNGGLKNGKHNEVLILLDQHKKCKDCILQTLEKQSKIKIYHTLVEAPKRSSKRKSSEERRGSSSRSGG